MFENIVKAVKTIISGIRKVPVSTLLIDIIGYIPKVIVEITNLISTTKGGISPVEAKQLIDSALDEFDNATGKDGLKLISDMPDEIMEDTLDHLKEVIRNISYCKAKVDGYYKSNNNSPDRTSA